MSHVWVTVVSLSLIHRCNCCSISQGSDAMRMLQACVFGGSWQCCRTVALARLELFGCSYLSSEGRLKSCCRKLGRLIFIITNAKVLVSVAIPFGARFVLLTLKVSV